MQDIDRIKDRIKPQIIQGIPNSTFIKQVAYSYQRLVINTYANTLFSY